MPHPGGQGRQHWTAHVVVLGCAVATSAPPRRGRRSPLPLYVLANALHPAASLSAAVLQHAIIVFQWTNNILVYVSIHRSRGLRLFSEYCTTFFFWNLLAPHRDKVRMNKTRIDHELRPLGIGHHLYISLPVESVVKMILMHTPVSYALGGWTTISSMGANCFYF